MKTETGRPAQAWKRKLAMAIGRPELATASDDELETAHDAHMDEMMDVMRTLDDEDDPGSQIRNGMPPGPASLGNEFPGEGAIDRNNPDTYRLANEQQRDVLRDSLINEAVHKQGIDREQARRQVRTLHPELFRNRAQQQGRSEEAMANEQERRDEILALVNEKMEEGYGNESEDPYDTCYRAVRRENPGLFKTQTTKGKK